MTTATKPRTEVLTLNGHWRVIADAERRQWVLIQRDDRGHDVLKLYCDRKEHLMERIRNFAGNVDGKAIGRLQRWPEAWDA